MTRTLTREPRQLRMAVRLFAVTSEFWPETTVQAASPAAAKYALFKRARETGYFPAGFREYLRQSIKVREVRQ